MTRLITSVIAIAMLFVEVDEANGFWTYTGGGILLLNVLAFIKQELNEQENI